MTSSQSMDYSLKKYLTAKNISIAIVILLVVYLIGLFNPLTGARFQYPYYQIGCGKDPITASSFMGKTYHSPDMKAYASSVPTATALFCTEEEALKAGYQRSAAK